MKRKLTSLVLVLLMICSLLNNIFVLNVKAEENNDLVSPTSVYSLNKVTTISNGVGAIEASAEDLAIFKDLDNFTMNTTFTVTTGTSTVQNIFFLGDSKQSANYISIYFKPADNTIGIESKNGGINDSFISSIKINDGKEHKLTFTVSKGNYYRFYVDGKKLREGTSATTFSKGVVANADHLIFGNGRRLNNANGYPLNGSLKNIELYNIAITENQILSYHEEAEEKGVFNFGSAYYKNVNDKKYEDTTENVLNKLKTLDKGAITIRYRANSETSGAMSLFSLSDSKLSGKYMNLYVNPSANEMGIEIAGTTSGAETLKVTNANLTSKGVSIKNTNWHTVTIVKTGSDASNRYTFYIDGKEIGFNSGRTGFTNKIDTADTIAVGHIKTSTNSNTVPFTGAINYVKVFDRTFTEAEIKSSHSVTVDVTKTELDLTNAYKTDKEILFYTGYKNSNAYRIPSLLTTKEGTVIAAIDKRNQSAGDWGDIDTMIRRREAGDSEFRDAQVILDLADNHSGGTTSAFLIDPSMVQDEETGRIYLLVDMYPESSGLLNTEILDIGTGYKKIDGKDYQLLYDSAKNEYTIRENGKVYDSKGNLTDYTVIVDCELPFKELGNIYKNGEYKGNAYLFSGSDKGELNVVRTSYLWLMHSDDDGKTWSLPKDITPQIKKDWMKFIGTGPGVGIQLENGNLVFPVYHTNTNVGGSQSSAVIISEDNGETWEIGDSPMLALGRNPETMTSGGMLTESQIIQTNNGEIKIFMRNTVAGHVYMATSKDGGRSWYKIEAIPSIPEIYCQLSVIDFERDGKEYILLSNPSVSGRRVGMVYLGEIAADGNITWTHSQLLEGERFQYSSLTMLPNGNFAVLYEWDDANNNIAICYTEFDEAWIKATNRTVNISNPKTKAINANVSGNKVTVNLELDQKVFVAGQPTLTLKIGDKTLEAAYKSLATRTESLVFEATLSGDEIGSLTAISINETNGIVENALGGKVGSINKALYDLTKINKDAYVGVTYTTQHSSSTAENTDGAATNVIDENPNTYWHSTWGNANITLPQSVTLELKEVTNIYKLAYLPRQNSSSGRVKDYDILTSMDGINFTKIVSGSFVNSSQEQSIDFIPVEAKYIKFQVTSAHAGGGASTAVAGLSLYKYTEGLFGEVNKKDLQAKIDETKEVIKGNYSEVTSNNVKELLNKAENILKADRVSQNMIDSIIKDIAKAEEKLIDVSKILKVLADFEEMDSKDYTSNSWTSYNSSIEKAKEAAKNATNKKDVTDALVRINYMQANLVRIDKTVLNTLYENSKDFTKNDYTKESWAIFEAAFNNAKSILDNVNSLQGEIDLAVEELQSAISGLEQFKEETDKSKLQALYAEALALVEDEYTSESWMSFNNIKTSVKAILDKEEATQEEVDNALAELKAAISQLEKLPVQVIDVSLLQELVNLVEEVDLTLYVEKGKDEFNSALAHAHEVLANPQSQEDIMESLNSLSKAYFDLRLLPDKELVNQLISFIEEMKMLDMSKYSIQTRSLALKVVENVNNVLANTNMTEEEVLAAIDEINDVKELMSNEEQNSEEEPKEEEPVKEEEPIKEEPGKEEEPIKEEPVKEEEPTKEEEPVKEEEIVKEKPTKEETIKVEDKKTTTKNKELPKTGSEAIYLTVTLGLALSGVGATLCKRKKED